MDYAEEQKGEIEAIEAIYYGEVQIISDSPFYKFSIPIKTEEFDSETESGICCDLVFTHTPKYPEEAPLIEIQNSILLEESLEFLDFLNKQIQENLGKVMVITIVSSAQEWLNVKYETIKKEQEETAARKIQEEEEAERERLEGTSVTVEMENIESEDVEQNKHPGRDGVVVNETSFQKLYLSSDDSDRSYCGEEWYDSDSPYLPSEDEWDCSDTVDIH